MIFATLTNGAIIIGLSANNVEKLMDGKPIHKKLEGLPEIWVVYGPTEAAILGDLRRAGLSAEPGARVHAIAEDDGEEGSGG
jgi:hypothetical protein